MPYPSMSILSMVRDTLTKSLAGGHHCQSGYDCQI